MKYFKGYAILQTTTAIPEEFQTNPHWCMKYRRKDGRNTSSTSYPPKTSHHKQYSMPWAVSCKVRPYKFWIGELRAERGPTNRQVLGRVPRGSILWRQRAHRRVRKALPKKSFGDVWPERGRMGSQCATYAIELTWPSCLTDLWTCSPLWVTRKSLCLFCPSQFPWSNHGSWSPSWRTSVSWIPDAHEEDLRDLQVLRDPTL